MRRGSPPNDPIPISLPSASCRRGASLCCSRDGDLASYAFLANRMPCAVVWIENAATIVATSQWRSRWRMRRTGAISPCRCGWLGRSSRRSVRTCRFRLEPNRCSLLWRRLAEIDPRSEIAIRIGWLSAEGRLYGVIHRCDTLPFLLKLH